MKPLPQSCPHPVALAKEWFAGDAVSLAPKLLGKIVKKGTCEGIVVETEAYTIDPASHAFRITPRSRAMRDTYGHWYVYFTYGMHWCANVTTNKGSVGAVLVRAVEPIAGIALMQRRRKVKRSDLFTRELCNGPAKFCKAFGIARKENGLPVGGEFAIYDAPPVAREDIAISTRIGVKNGKDLLWRFYVKDSPFVSR